MDRVELILPPTGDDAVRADAYAAAPLLNCLLREVAEPVAPGVYRLPGVDRLLRVRGGRRPAGPEVRTDGRWRHIGHEAKRLDIPAKVNGTAQYGIDVRVPGMMVAAILQSPRFGGRLDLCDWYHW